ncbi:MAG: TSUP family transporter [Alphaproteobacteria bacterium]|nr:TSUP family transporter [Alphaproteobacteria bacterium]
MPFDESLAIAVIGVFFAGLSRGFSDFGAALIVMPILSILYGPVPAVVMMTLMEVPATALLLPSFIRHANWGAVMPLGLASLVTIPLGGWILVSLDTEVLQRSIAILVLIFAALLATGWRYRRPPTMPVMLGVGGLSGLIGGAANMSGPLVVVFLLAGQNTAHQVRAGVMAYFSFSTLLRVAVYAWHGLYAVETLTLGAILTLPYLIGIWVGSRLFRGVSDRAFRILVLSLVAVMGVAALLW